MGEERLNTKGESFSFGHPSAGADDMCTSMVENSREFAVANGLDIVATRLLEDTKRLSVDIPKRRDLGRSA